MGLKARAIMQPQVTSVSEDTPLLDVHRLFVEEAIHGAPVIRDDGVLIGIITSADLLRAILEEHESGGTGVQYLREFLEFSGPDWVERTGDFQDGMFECGMRRVVAACPECCDHGLNQPVMSDFSVKGGEITESSFQKISEHILVRVCRFFFFPANEMQKGIIGNRLLIQPVLKDLTELGQGIFSMDQALVQLVKIPFYNDDLAPEGLIDVPDQLGCQDLIHLIKKSLVINGQG